MNHELHSVKGLSGGPDAFMLKKFGMAGVHALLSLSPSLPSASRIGYKHALRAPALSRPLSGGREAARNAKAHLLRASAVAEASIADRRVPLAQSKFLELRVDDRVVVSLPVGRCALMNDISSPTFPLYVCCLM